MWPLRGPRHILIHLMNENSHSFLPWPPSSLTQRSHLLLGSGLFHRTHILCLDLHLFCLRGKLSSWVLVSQRSLQFLITSPCSFPQEICVCFLDRQSYKKKTQFSFTTCHLPAQSSSDRLCMEFPIPWHICLACSLLTDYRSPIA